MKTVIVLLLLLAAKISLPQHEMKSSSDVKDVRLIPGLGSYSFKVSTDNELAQKFFDQGLTLIYAFNHEEAIRSFKKAASIDHDLAMAYWGIAFSLGPNYNLPADNEQRKNAYKYLKKAIKHRKHATEKETDFINALSKRYSGNLSRDQSELNKDFRTAMKSVYDKYPDDPDAGTIYAESMMVLKPWQLWDNNGNPAEGTLEIVSVLEGVLKKTSNHPGANHYYIHAVEASKDPGKALNSAVILKTLVPAAGHLVHMPAHTLFRIGDYSGASDANIAAIKSDENYITVYNPAGIYPVMYYNHNINFLSVSRMFEGKYNESINEAKKIESNTREMMNEMQMLESFHANPLMILIAFNKWDEILYYKAPEYGLNTYSSIVHFARGIAFAAKNNAAEADNELILFEESKSKVKPEDVIGTNSAVNILNLAGKILSANILLSKSDTAGALALLTEAKGMEDKINYDEPPDWYPSVRLNLGKILFSSRKYIEAENIFREDLKKYPHNGRGLFGLYQSLKEQNKTDEAEKYYQEFNDAWKNSDFILTMDNL